ncbi:MAG: PAS domain S-box protein, partial [Methanobacteriota archaeon]
RESLAAAALSAVAYAAVLAAEGTLTADPAEVAMRIAFLFVIGALASLLSSESYVQLAGRLRMREHADESKTVSPDLALGPALDRAVASARRLLGADAAAVLLLERADGTAGIADSSGLSEDAVAAADEAFRLAVEAGWPDRAPLPPRLVPNAAAPRLRHERAHALVFHGHVRGALLVHHGPERTPDEDDEDVGRLFASRTAAVIEHARLVDGLRRQTELHERFLEAQSDLGEAVLVTDGTRILHANEAATHLLGYARRELLDLPSFLVLVPESDRAAVLLRTERRLAGYDVEEHYESTLRARDGREIRVEVSAKGIDFGGSRRILAILRDITERKRAEEARAMLAGIVESSNDAIVAERADGVLLSWNRGAEAMYGYSAEEAVGRHFSFLVPPEAEGEVERILAAIRGGEAIRDFETVRVRKDGHRVHVSISQAPLRDPDGRVIGSAAIARDVTAFRRAKAELERYAVALEESYREMAVLFQELQAFTASVSHDLRAPVRTIEGFTKAVLEDQGESLTAESRDFLRRAHAASLRMEELIDGLLALARATRAEMKTGRVDLSAMATTLADELQKRDPARDVKVTVEPGLFVEGDPVLLRSLLENLMGNAWKFTSRHPGATIEVGKSERRGTTVFHVRDTGAGFDAARAERLFEPFRRFHSEKEYPGTGVGLATVRQIVRRHGGRVWAESEPGKGATFFFTIGSRREVIG